MINEWPYFSLGLGYLGLNYSTVGMLKQTWDAKKVKILSVDLGQYI